MNDSISEIYVFVITGILLFGILAGFIVFFIITYYKKQQQNSKEKLQLQTKFNEDLLKSTIEIQEKAFDDISRELHDNIGQQLSSASIYLNLMLLENSCRDHAKLQSCKEIITGSIQDIRQLSQTLLGQKITNLGLVQSVQTQINRINKLGISTASLETNTSDICFDPKKEIILFRIIQEAINNATKHTPGCEIKISITKMPNHSLTIIIDDKGKGFAMDNIKNAGVGLINMQSRAETIGANLTITSRENEGTQITISVPQEKLSSN